jgi:membrane protease YdiL (CAAX protease family)
MIVLEIIKDACGKVNFAMLIDFLVFLPGTLLFGIWLLKTSFGRYALAGSPPRRNNMPPYLPFVPFFIWVGVISLSAAATEKLLPSLQDWQKAVLDNLILCIGAIIAMAVIVLLARASFPRRLKGFGLDAKTIYKDFPAAFLNLFTVWPLITAALLLTIYLGTLIIGPDFEIQPHEELEMISTYAQLPLRVLIIVIAAMVVPVFEEMLFRGLFQTMLRSILTKPWPAIAISSALFVMAHENPGHWPGLFVLSMCMGYSYEKSGSLLRPIFIHSLFNTVSIIGTLYTV